MKFSGAHALKEYVNIGVIFLFIKNPYDSYHMLLSHILIGSSWFRQKNCKLIGQPQILIKKLQDVIDEKMLWCVIIVLVTHLHTDDSIDEE